MIKTVNLASNRQCKLIENFASHWNSNFNDLQNFLTTIFNIYCSIDKDIIEPYKRDWSNIDGNADILVKPINTTQCAVILKIAYYCKIPITVSAGQTNLTGSATPKEGVVLSTSLLTSPEIQVNKNKKEVKLDDSLNEINKRNSLKIIKAQEEAENIALFLKEHREKIKQEKIKFKLMKEQVIHELESSFNLKQ